jgi:hypothetical protein
MAKRPDPVPRPTAPAQPPAPTPPPAPNTGTAPRFLTGEATSEWENMLNATQLAAFRGDMGSIKGTDMEVVLPPGEAPRGAPPSRRLLPAPGGTSGARHCSWTPNTPSFNLMASSQQETPRHPAPPDFCLCDLDTCLTPLGTKQCNPPEVPGTPHPPPPAGVRAVVQTGQTVTKLDGVPLVYNWTVDAGIGTQVGRPARLLVLWCCRRGPTPCSWSPCCIKPSPFTPLAAAEPPSCRPTLDAPRAVPRHVELPA